MILPPLYVFFSRQPFALPLEQRPRIGLCGDANMCLINSDNSSNIVSTCRCVDVIPVLIGLGLINYVLKGTCVKWNKIPNVVEEFGQRVSREEVKSVKACKGMCLIDYPSCHSIEFSQTEGCTVHYAEGRLLPSSKETYHWKIERIPCEGMFSQKQI